MPLSDQRTVGSPPLKVWVTFMVPMCMPYMWRQNVRQRGDSWLGVAAEGRTNCATSPGMKSVASVYM